MKSGLSFILGKEKWRHTHPVSILLYTKRFWFFLVIPTLRGLIFAFFSCPVYWAETMWIDVALLGAILLYGCFCWAGEVYRVKEHQLIVRKGLIFSREWRFPLRAFHGIFQMTPLVFQPFSLTFFGLETLGGKQRPDVLLLLSRKRGMELLKAFSIDRPVRPMEYQPRPYHLALFALLCSNSFGGVVLLGFLLSRAGSLIGRQLEQEFAGALVGIAQPACRWDPFGSGCRLPSFNSWLVFRLFAQFGTPLSSFGTGLGRPDPNYFRPVAPPDLFVGKAADLCSAGLAAVIGFLAGPGDSFTACGGNGEKGQRLSGGAAGLSQRGDAALFDLLFSGIGSA